MLPEGADAVLILENSQQVNRLDSNDQAGDLKSKVIEITRAVTKGENVLQVGEDVAEGQTVIPSGTRLRPAEIGGCMALGICELRVAISPKIGIISSGDEVVPPDVITRPGQVRDVNTYSLAGVIKNAGGTPAMYGIVPDSLNEMKDVAAKALNECDCLVITAGSSASARDTTAEAITSLGKPGVLIHGINIRPGKPTILAVCDGKPVIGLPGNPVSALVIAGLFLVPVVEKLLGVNVKPKGKVQATLTINQPSQAGREDWVAVRLVQKASDMDHSGENKKFLAEPIFGKSNLIFSLSKADGLIRIPGGGNGDKRRRKGGC